MQTGQWYALSAIDDPTRFRVFALCSHRDFELSELARVIGKAEGIVRQHVAILVKADLLKSKSKGSRLLYRVDENSVHARAFMRLIDLAVLHAKLSIADLYGPSGEGGLKACSDHERSSQSEYDVGDRISIAFTSYFELDKSIKKASAAGDIEEMVDLGGGGARIVKSLLSLD